MSHLLQALNMPIDRGSVFNWAKRLAQRLGVTFTLEISEQMASGILANSVEDEPA
jgi:hypothetical protein